MNLDYALNLHFIHNKEKRAVKASLLRKDLEWSKFVVPEGGAYRYDGLCVAQSMSQTWNSVAFSLWIWQLEENRGPLKNDWVSLAAVISEMSQGRLRLHNLYNFDEKDIVKGKLIDRKFNPHWWRLNKRVKPNYFLNHHILSIFNLLLFLTCLLFM